LGSDHRPEDTIQHPVTAVVFRRQSAVSVDSEPAAGGPPLPLEQLYRRHGHVVLRRARRLLGSDDEAQEVLQELFASLVARPDAFAGRSAVTTWLYGATTNLCLNRLRNARTQQRLLEEE